MARRDRVARDALTGAAFFRSIMDGRVIYVAYWLAANVWQGVGYPR
jgi:hypothetical protein